MIEMANRGPDLSAVKAKQRVTWAAGDYAVIGTTLQWVGESLCEAMDLRSGQRVLDVAAGNGNVSLAAARRFCEVTSTDYVAALLERGRGRAAAEGHQIDFREADAEELPFADASFDAVVSTFGVMFTADHARAAREMVRVCRPGGAIGLACWTPEGFIGEMFKVNSRFVPPPPGLQPAVRWGTRAYLGEILGEGARAIHTTQREFVFRYRSPEHWLEVFRTWYGPTVKAFAAVEPARQGEFAEALLDLARRYNRAKDGTLAAPATYLETVIERA